MFFFVFFCFCPCRSPENRIVSHRIRSRQLRRLEPHDHARTNLPVRQGCVTRALPRWRSRMRSHVGSPLRAGGEEKTGGRHAMPCQEAQHPNPNAPHQEGPQLPRLFRLATGPSQGRARGRTTVSFFVVCSRTFRPYRRGSTQGLSLSLIFPNVAANIGVVV